MGIYVDRAPYGDVDKAKAIKMIQLVRQFILLPKETEKGLRFNDDADVLVRLETMAPAEKFNKDPLGSVQEALRDAASADWWYCHECGCADMGPEEPDEAELYGEERY